jgi:hypothetical protein
MLLRIHLKSESCVNAHAQVIRSRRLLGGWNLLRELSRKTAGKCFFFKASLLRRPRFGQQSSKPLDPAAEILRFLSTSARSAAEAEQDGL